MHYVITILGYTLGYTDVQQYFRKLNVPVACLIIL